MVTSVYVQFGVFFRHRLFLALQYLYVIPQNDSRKVERSSFWKQTTSLFLWLVMEFVLPNHDLDLHVNLHINLPRTYVCLMHTLT